VQTLLFLVPILGCLAIALGRVVAFRSVPVDGAPLGEVRLTFRERTQYHRSAIYAVGALMLLGAVTGHITAPVEMLVAVAMFAIVEAPVRYRFTTTGVALGNVIFRPWTEFSGYRATRKGIAVIGRPGMGAFWIRTTGPRTDEALKWLSKRLSTVSSARAAYAPAGGLKRLRAAAMLAPVFAVILALGLTAALADGPDVDPTGTNVGVAAGDLPGVGVPGGFGLTSDGTVDPALAAQQFETAKADEPFASTLANYVNQDRIAINFIWVLVCGYLVMFMQAGFAMVETGFCRAKSARHVMMTNFMVYGIGMLAYWAVGFAIAFGGVGLTGPTNLGSGLLALNKEAHVTIAGTQYGIFGYKGFFLGPNSLDVGIAVLFLFQMVFMDTAATILTGAVAERWTWMSFMVWGVFVGALVQPVAANWAWGGGWLFGLVNSGLGRPYVDFAGSGVVHMVGGWAALAGAIVLGPRLGKYNKDGSANAMPGHNLNMAAIGTFILAFGWFGFNPGSTLGAAGSGNLRIGEIAVVTMLAGAAGSVSAMAYAKASLGKYDPGYMINGILAGLVAITAPSGYVSPTIAVLIGAIAGVLVCRSMVFVERTLKDDDPVGAFSVHGVCGAFGVLAVGLFADGTAPDFLVVGHPIKGLFFGDGRQLVAQVIGMAAIAAWSFATTYVLFKVLMAMGIYRSAPEDELRGLDLPEMGTYAYPVEDIPAVRGREPGTYLGPSAAPAPTGGQ
jgi:Amt family ammonium transporter